MENLTSVWQIGLIALVAGALIGVLAYRLFSTSNSKTEQIRTELDETRDELASYKASVQTHFDRTSELVNELTQNYARVYQHLAEGAHKLGDSQALNNLLEQEQGRVVIAVGDEAPENDPLADEVAAAQARASMDVPLGESAVSDDTDIPVAASDTADDEARPGVDAAEQVGWEPTSPVATGSAFEAEQATGEPAGATPAETDLEATQKFTAESEPEPGSAEAGKPETEAGDKVDRPEDEDVRQKSKQKETETA